MTKKIPALCGVLLVLMACGVSRGQTPQAKAARILTDREGTSFSLSGIPERIVSGAPSNTEIIAGLGLADRIIATDPYSIKVDGVRKDIPQIDFFYPDAEILISLEPDLIIANGYNRFGAGDDPFRLLRESGIPVAYIPMGNSIEGIYDDIAFIAEALGAEEGGASLIQTMKAAVEELRETGKSIRQKRRVYFEISPAPDMVSFGKNTFLHAMLEITGAVNIFENETGIIFPSAESVIKKDPDVILSNVDYRKDPLDEIRRRPGFDRISAVRNNALFLINADSSARPSQNIVKALRQIAHAVYGEYYEPDGF